MLLTVSALDPSSVLSVLRHTCGLAKELSILLLAHLLLPSL